VIGLQHRTFVNEPMRTSEPSSTLTTRSEYSLTGGSRTYRLFFTVDDDAEIVRVLHVRRGSRQPPGPDELKASR
jgi:hypothetical protein